MPARQKKALWGWRWVAAMMILAPGLALAQDDVPMRAMKDELRRALSTLQLQKLDKPYFLGYRLDDVTQIHFNAMLGSLTAEQPTHLRLLGVEVRVGDYALDNSNYVSAASFGGGMAGIMGGISQAPLDDNYQQIRRDFWLATDNQYKKALEDLSGKRAALQMRQHTEEPPDFSKESPVVEIQPRRQTETEQEKWKALARDISAVFKSMPELYNSSVELEYRDSYVRYINSEGSSFTRDQPIFKLIIKAQAQASNGLPISDSINLYARTFAELPAESVLIARTQSMAGRILKLRSAASMERYSGPILFEAHAAGEIFLQQFAPGLMAVRAPISDDPRFEAFFPQLMDRLGGRSFVDKIGGPVLPDFLDVSDNPLLADFKGEPLLGSSAIDDDAVKTRATKLVEHGVLKTLLATRVPVRAVPRSTGSRHGWGPAPSNLIVTSSKSSSDEELRKELLRRVKDRGMEYGVVVRRVGGGAAASFMRLASRMTGAGQAGPSLAEVYKVFPDGREELIQGVDIAEMTPAAFKDIVAAGDTTAVYTDEFIPRLGALFSMGLTASSDLPIVSVVTPALLFDDLSLVKTEGPYPNLPISPSPLVK
ncbi:MAG: hypothetical protein JOY93_06455 [Acidobacteriales bacterium]|nr:hypothetical protein [Terriglobales bacterium]